MRWITPLVHPASILRGRPALAPVQVAHLRRLAAAPHAEPVDVSQDPPGCLSNPTLDSLRAFTAAAKDPLPSTVVLDIENAGPVLVCCGVMQLQEGGPGPGVCFRFRRAGGDPWWNDWAQHQEVVGLLHSLLADPRITKVFHFGIQHDAPLLEELGFTVAGPLLDTSALCHAVHSELRKGLQFLATAFCGAPRWKDIPDEKEADAPDAEAEADE